MTMQRRSFLASILGAAMAPAIVRAESLMKLPAPTGWQLEGGVLVQRHVFPNGPICVATGDVISITDTWGFVGAGAATLRTLVLTEPGTVIAVDVFADGRLAPVTRIPPTT